MPVEQFTPDHPLWQRYLSHLQRAGMANEVIEPDNQPRLGVYFLGVPVDDMVVGHISLAMQEIIIPATDWSGGRDTPLVRSDGELLREMFVQTFSVDEAHRRQGHGRALQLAALELTRNTGCYQMRSWSSLDKVANFALKLSLGFAVYPAVYETASGLRVSGVYFAKTV